MSIATTLKAVELLNLIAAEVGTADKNACISIAIKMLVDSGLSVSEAYDTIFGAGAYNVMAEQIYNDLRNAQKVA